AKDLGILNKPSKTENGPEFTIWSKSSDKSKDELEKSKDELEKSKDNLDKSKDELEKSKDNLDKSKDELEKSATNTNPTGKYMPVANCYYSNYIKQIVNQRNPKDSFSKKRDVFEHKESD
ncbi:putative Av71 muscle cell intermediate filament, partial [Pseudoloma neurophilia]